MKYVNFNKIVIKNFLSVGETPVVVDFNTGLNILTGNNKDKTDRRNGVGKSTVADSIYFAIFGDTLRTIKRDHIVNNSTQRGCEVELTFTINVDGVMSEYRVVRKISPSKCYLYKNGDDITRDTIQNTTNYIQELLNTTPELFQNCVIMTINNATPFMAKKKLEKRKFIEGIFNLQVFSDMLTDVRTEYNKVGRELDIECAKYEEISNTLNSQHEQKSSDELNKQRNKEKLNARKKNQQNEIKNIKKAIDSIEDVDVSDVNKKLSTINELLPKVDTKIQQLISKKGKISATIELYKQKRDRLSSEHKKCPTCLHELDDSHKKIIDEEKKSLESSIESAVKIKSEFIGKLAESQELRDSLTQKRNKQTEKLQQAQIQKNNKQNLNQQLRQYLTQLKDTEDDIKSLETTQNDFDKIINETTNRLEKTQEGIDKIKREMAKLDIIKFIVSEEGVKSYIVKKMLQLFNSKLSHYLKKMDSNCICVFNEYFEEEIIDEKGKPCSYFNFSGAERKNIDLACLFAFMDIRRLQGDVAFNFSMYDELFDSSLDERGVELVIDILKERIENHNECVIVISHRKESTKLATGEVIFLEKQNGVTIRVETPESELK